MVCSLPSRRGSRGCRRGRRSDSSGRLISTNAGKEPAQNRPSAGLGHLHKRRRLRNTGFSFEDGQTLIDFAQVLANFFELLGHLFTKRLYLDQVPHNNAQNRQCAYKHSQRGTPRHAVHEPSSPRDALAGTVMSAWYHAGRRANAAKGTGLMTVRFNLFNGELVAGQQKLTLFRHPRRER